MSTKPTKTIQQLAQLSLDVQGACNLSGVVKSFAVVLSDLWAHAGEGKNRGTDWVNCHPISLVWADKIASLTHIQSCGDDSVMDAYKIVHKLAAGEHNEEWGA